MFQKLMIAALVKAICAALCQLFGWCVCEDDCPDGICNDALRAIDELQEGSPTPVASPAKPMAFDFDFQWDKLQGLVDATVAFVDALRAFLGINKVG